MSDDDIDNEFETDDFDMDDFDDDGFDDLNDQQGTLGDLWRNNPLVKIGVILVAFAFLVGGVILFGGKSEKDPISVVRLNSDVDEVTGGDNEISPQMEDAFGEMDTTRREDAIRTGGSVIPTPIAPVKGRVPEPFEEPEEEDPLERWRRMQDERIRQQQIQAEKPTPEQVPEVPVDTRTPAINALSQAMSQQMEGVLGNQQVKGPIVQNVASISYLEALAEKERQKREAALAAAQLQLANGAAVDELNVLIPAGTIEYAQLLTEANTDAPGPILAQIATGPLKGGRLIGSFTATDNFLTLNFNTIVLDGVDYAAQGVAIDPDTTLPGVVTDIDRRYFKRIVLPMAAEFITGLADAVSNSGRTTVTISGDTVTETTSNDNQDDDQEVASGISAAGEELGDILDELSDNAEPLLRVRAGTPVGVLFVTSVVDTPNVTQQRLQEQQQRENQLPSQPLQNVITLPPGITSLQPSSGLSNINVSQP